MGVEEGWLGFRAEGGRFGMRGEWLGLGRIGWAVVSGCLIGVLCRGSVRKWRRRRRECRGGWGGLGEAWSSMVLDCMEGEEGKKIWWATNFGCIRIYIYTHMYVHDKRMYVNKFVYVVRATMTLAFRERR